MCRPADNDEGRKMVQWRQLHFLLPQGPLSIHKLTVNRLLVAAGGVMSLPACLASVIYLSLSCYTVCYFRGTLLPLTPHSFSKKGGAKVPRETPEPKRFVFICWSLIVYCVYHLGARSDRLRPFLCQILV